MNSGDLLTDVRWLQEQMNNETSMNSEETDDDDSAKKIAGQVLSNIFLFFLIFGLSATVDMKHMKEQLTNKFAIGCGVGMQFVIMPLLGYIAVVSLRNEGFTQAMGIALLVVTSSPGGSYSNWWCSMFNADLALSVAMTTVSSLLSIGLLVSWKRFGPEAAESWLVSHPTYLPVSH